MKGNMKKILMMAVIAVTAIAVVNRIPKGKRLING